MPTSIMDILLLSLPPLPLLAVSEASNFLFLVHKNHAPNSSSLYLRGPGDLWARIATGPSIKRHNGVCSSQTLGPKQSGSLKDNRPLNQFDSSPGQCARELKERRCLAYLGKASKVTNSSKIACVEREDTVPTQMYTSAVSETRTNRSTKFNGAGPGSVQ